MASYNKLVRDRIPEILDAKGVSYEKRIATEDEYLKELQKKLGEEVAEFMKDPTTEELADVLEVLEALRLLPGYQDLDKVRWKKREERGGFEQRIILKGEYT